MASLIEVRGLTKNFGTLTAVDDIALDVERGEVLGFLGPNGAGKSTTMKMITGFLAPTAGSIAVCGFDIEGGAAARGESEKSATCPKAPRLTAK